MQKPEAAFDMLQLPLADWRRAVNMLTPMEREDMERDAAHLSQRAATLSAYMTRQNGTQKGNDKAVKHAQRVTTRVRKALGFTIPTFDVSF